MFEDERERASLHRPGAIARGVAKRGLVAFPGLRDGLWHHAGSVVGRGGAEGIAGAVAQAATPSEGTGAAGGAADQGNVEVSDSGSAPAASTATTGAAATKARRRGRTLPRVSSLRRYPLTKQDLPPRLPVQTENPTETGDVAKKQVEVSFSIIGIDADGKAQTWVAPTQLKLDEGATGWTPSLSCSRRWASRRNTIRTRHPVFTFESITSPSDGRTLAFDPATYAYWQLFVDGASSSVGASGVKLTQGQKFVCLYGW